MPHYRGAVKRKDAAEILALLKLFDFILLGGMVFFMPYIDHNDLVAMVKTLIDDVERLKQNNTFYVTRLDTQAKVIAELQARVSALQYKGQDD